MTGEKSGIEKVLDDFDGEFPELNDFPEVGDDIKSFLRSAIETAFKEVRPEKVDEEYNQFGPMDYNHAIDHYDQAVDKYFGK